MIGTQRVLALVPARGGSKAVPRKNVREVGGKPLLAYTVDAALASSLIDRLIVSSDDAEILAAAHGSGAETLVRPAPLASDEAATLDVVLHALDAVPSFDIVVVLQPTSPLRTTSDIDGAVRACIDAGAPACVSVCAVSESPYWMFTVGSDRRLRPLLDTPGRASRRQDLPDVLRLNGAVYVARTAWLRRTRAFVTPETIGYEMPESRSLDIDTEIDLAWLEWQQRLPSLPRS